MKRLCILQVENYIVTNNGNSTATGRTSRFIMNLNSAYFNLNFCPRGNDTDRNMQSILLPVQHIHPPDSLGIVNFVKIYLGRLEVMVS